METQLEILHRDNLHEGGFAGLREHRLVANTQVFGRDMGDAWPGLGNFVYLADARFNPKGETRLHPHREIDVISVMVEGRIAHEGSLEHGSTINQYEVQVQRAGGEGFTHNEINPDDEKNRMLQLWVLPEKAGEPAGYKVFRPVWGETTRIYGGKEGETKSFAAKTTLDIAMLKVGQSVDIAADGLSYVAKGQGDMGGTSLKDGDLFRGLGGQFVAGEDVVLVLVNEID